MENVLWITVKISVQLFLPHTQWSEFSQLDEGFRAGCTGSPQSFPQPAHNLAGVLHSLSTVPSTAAVGIRRGGSAKCQWHPLQRCEAYGEECR